MRKDAMQSVFPGWIVERKLGEGSFGGVFEIVRILPDGKEERSALKKLTVPKDPEEIDVLRSQKFSDERISAYFRQQMEELVAEYVFMQELGESPSVVSCQDIRYEQHEDGIGWDIYIRMELLQPLKRYIAREYNEYQVLRLGMDICRALMACERNHIIHRDIKPENILVTEAGRYKLGDFGIAKVSEKTETGTMAGTNGYMAPEVANRQHYGREVDIYSLGMVLYWMMNNNTLPFLPQPPQIPTAEQRQEAWIRRLTGEPLPSPCNGSQQLKQVVGKACAFDPKDRFQSAREFGAALQQIYRNLKATDTAGILQEIGITKELLDGDPGSSISSGRKNTKQPVLQPSQNAELHGKAGKKLKKRSKWIVLAGIILLLTVAFGLFTQSQSEKKNVARPTVSATETAAPIQQTESVTVETTATVPPDPFQYVLCDTQIRITGWNETLSEEASIPEEIDGLPVTEIGEKAFFNCEKLTSIRLPASVKTIEIGAFMGCVNLTEVILPQEMDVLKENLFSGCTALSQISLSDSITAIEDGVFENCESLSSLNLPHELKSLGPRVFSGCTQLNDVTLPDSLEHIGAAAFQNCVSLTGIDIPDAVMEIGSEAFYGSMMLTATVPVRFMDSVSDFIPETCEVTYTGIEKPQLEGEVGDFITFGSYEQDNDLMNGSEPIEWQILEKDGTKLTLISKYGLDSQRYHDNWEVVTWETCKVRVWLNTSFYASAFNPVEQTMILSTDIRSIHPSGSYPSKTVQDKVFLLDHRGSYAYFPSTKSRTCAATEYAKAQGSTVGYGDRCWWWLREGYFVDLGSIPNIARANFTDYGGTVRPMICIDTAS